MSSIALATQGRTLGGVASWLADAPGTRFRFALFCLYALHVVTGLSAHAMWLDEVQAWLLVRDSNSLAELTGHLAYEGHPLGWYLLLWPLKAFGTRPELAQVAQGACALATAAIIIWRGPFGRLELALVLLSYPSLFEYAVKARSYALGCLLLFLFCAAFSSRRRDLVLAALVALLWNVHVLFGLTSLGCIAAVFARRADEHGFRRLFKPWDVLPAALILVGIGGAALVAVPAPDSGFATGWHFDLQSDHLRTTRAALGTLPFGPAISATLSDEARRAAVLAGFGIVVVALARWRRAPPPAALLAVAFGTTLLFMHAKYGNEAWHRSILFVTLLASIWIARGLAGPRGPALLPRWFLPILLATQAVGGISAAWSDRVVPYSAGRGVAAALQAAGLEHAPIFALQDFQAAPVPAYLGTTVFYAPGMREGSFIVLDRKRLEPVDLRAAIDLAAAREGAVVLDCRTQMPEGPPPDPRLREWGRFPAEMDSCVVYRFGS